MGDNRKAREQFNTEVAPQLVKELGLDACRPAFRTGMFAQFEDDRHLVMVAGRVKGVDVQRALARGLGQRQDRRLVLILPDGHQNATLQRSAWLRPEAQPEIHLHNDHRLRTRRDQPLELQSREAATRAFVRRLEVATSAPDLQTDFDAATIPKHLGRRGEAIDPLIEWASSHPLLDPAHRRGTRSWHHMGQRVLSIHPTRGGLRITAGIHYSARGAAPDPHDVTGREPLTLEPPKILVECGVGSDGNAS